MLNYVSLVEQCLSNGAHEVSMTEVMTLIARQLQGHQERAARTRHSDAQQVVTQPVQHSPVIRVSQCNIWESG